MLIQQLQKVEGGFVLIITDQFAKDMGWNEGDSLRMQKSSVDPHFVILGRSLLFPDPKNSPKSDDFKSISDVL